MAARLIDGKSIAQSIRLELKNKIEESKKNSIQTSLSSRYFSRRRSS